MLKRMIYNLYLIYKDITKHNLQMLHSYNLQKIIRNI